MIRTAVHSGGMNWRFRRPWYPTALEMTDDSADSVAFDHAWKWFELHANQRMTMFRFYLIAIGGMSTGVGYLWINAQYFLAAIVALIGGLTSFCFMHMDRRVRDLVKIGEDALSVKQAKVADKFGPAFALCLRSKNARGPYPYTYGETFRLLFFGAMLVFFGLTGFGIYKGWAASPVTLFDSPISVPIRP